MIRFYLIIIVFNVKIIFAQQPNLLFAKSFGGASGDQANSIAVDLNKNIYVAGEFNNTTDFNPNSGVANLTSVGMTDLFFAKYDATGNYVWAKSIGTTNRETVNSISVDKNGNSYITGYFEGVADFDPGTGNALLSPFGPGRDFYFAKYDASGNYLWAKNLNGGNTDIGNSLAIDSIGNVYITGYFSQTLDFDPGPGTATLTGNSQAIFFAKYDSLGNYIWAHNLESIGYNKGNSITLDHNGNIYVTGIFSSTIDFDPGPAIAQLNSSGQSMFFSKYDNMGNYVWANKIGVSSNDNSYDIAIDAINNVLITGVFNGTKDFDCSTGTATLTSVGFGDVFFAKYDENGNYLWAKGLGASGWEESAAIVSDKNNSIYISGYYSNNIDFDPGPAVTILTSTGAPQIFLAKYDLNGDYMWAYGFGATNSDESKDITLDVNGNVYLTGYFEQTVDFDHGAGTTNLTSVAASPDVFFAKYSSTTIIGINEINTTNNLISISPNPCQNTFNLFIENQIEDGEISITNTFGQNIQHQKISKGISTINTSVFPKGLYFYSITQSNKQLKSGKIIVE